MNIKYNKKLFYSNKLKFIKIFIYIYLIININQLNFIFEEKTINVFFNIIKLIISITIFIFLNNLMKTSKRKIYRIMQIFLFILIIFLILSISSNNQFTEIKKIINFLQYNNFISIDNYYQLGSFYIFSKYRYKEDRSCIYLECLLIIIFMSLIILGISYNSTLFSKISIFSSIIILIITGIDIYKKRIKMKCIDLFEINFVIFTIFFIISYIKKYYNLDFNIKVLISLKETVLLTTFIIIIKTYIDKNFNIIFKEIKESQISLEDLNVRMKINNYKLEKNLEKIKEIQNMYKDYLKHFTNPIVIINNNFRIIYSNKEFLNIIKENNIKNVINKKLSNLMKIDINFNDINNDEFSNTYVTEFQNSIMEIKVIKLNNKNEKSKYILLFNDLSEDRKIIEMKEKLEYKKMRESLKKNFLSSIYHDLKTPVNLIYSAVQLEELLIEKNDIERLENYNNISKKNCITLTQLTNNLIDMSKIDYENIKATMELDNIVEFIEDYLTNLSEYIKNNNINLIFDTEEEEIFIYFDKEMMMRIISNLVSNALKFTKEDGEIKILIKLKNEKVIIQISDTGIGMKKEFIERAFDKYEIENRQADKGSGIGLFVVYNLVKAQNGDIKIESKLNRGTTFTITLNK